MSEGDQIDLLSPISELRLVQLLLEDFHDDLVGRVARFRQLTDLSSTLGSYGTMLPGGETTFAAWTEARASFIHGNFVATVMLCQGLAEHILAAHLSMGLDVEELPRRISFSKTLERCLKNKTISNDHARDLRSLMELRNPLSHFRGIDDPSNLSRRTLDTKQEAQFHLFSDASFAIGVAVRLLSLPAFRVDG